MRHVFRDGGRNLAVPISAGHREKRGRGRDNTLGLPGQRKRGECRGNPLFRDPLDNASDFQEGVYGGSAREHCQHAHSEKSEQQTTPYAEALKHNIHQVYRYTGLIRANRSRVPPPQSAYGSSGT